MNTAHDIHTQFRIERKVKRKKVKLLKVKKLLFRQNSAYNFYDILDLSEILPGMYLTTLLIKSG